MEIAGIDVSRWQGDVDWEQVKKAGVGFVMLRAAAGLQEDVRFRENARGAAAAGIPMGAYLYSLARTPAEAEAEAEFLLKQTEGILMEYPLAYDIEDGVQEALTREERTALVEHFCRKIQEAGRYVLLYSSKFWLENRFVTERIARYDHWVAQWNRQNTYRGNAGMWQYTNTGRVNGIRGYVDGNVAYRDYPKLTAALKNPGWRREDGKWYYGEVQDRWEKIEGRWYWFDKDGVMATGCRSIGGKWYYLAEKTAGPLKEGQCVFTDGTGALPE